MVGVVVRRYIDILTIIITFPYSTCISSFLAAASLYFFVHIYKPKNIRDRSKKSRSHKYNY